MGKRIEIEWIDDLDGSQAEETVAFSLGRKSFEIDLSAENAARLRAELEPFTGAARRLLPRR